MDNIAKINISPNITPILIIQHSSPGVEIVRIEANGKITWPNGIDIDAAAKAFESALTLGVECSAGITHRVRSDIRDEVYKEIIEECKTKEFLTVDDLTYLQEATKIVGKLKRA